MTIPQIRNASACNNILGNLNLAMNQRHRVGQQHERAFNRALFDGERPFTGDIGGWRGVDLLVGCAI